MLHSIDHVSSCQMMDWCLTLSQNVQTETHQELFIARIEYRDRLARFVSGRSQTLFGISE